MHNVTKSEMFKTLDHYFRNGRPRDFQRFEQSFLSAFPEALRDCTPVDGIMLASTLFLFSYTLSTEYKVVQDKIHDHICKPYENWIKANFKSSKSANKLQYKNSHLFILRHAVTSGLYSPGQTSFFIIKLLLENNAEVCVVTRGRVDEKFDSLKKKYKNFSIIQLNPNESRENILDYLEKVCLSGLFTKIFTDQEFSETSFISVLHNLDNLILLSAGYYRVPWYAKVFKPNVLGSAVNDREIITPMPIELELLSPEISPLEISELKKNLTYTDNDIIFGCFARLEKFTQEYVDKSEYILNKIPDSKLLIF